MPKKEFVVAPMMAIKQTSITFGSMEVLLNENEEPIVNENLDQSSL